MSLYSLCPQIPMACNHDRAFYSGKAPILNNSTVIYMYKQVLTLVSVKFLMCGSGNYWNDFCIVIGTSCFCVSLEHVNVNHSLCI